MIFKNPSTKSYRLYSLQYHWSHTYPIQPPNTPKIEAPCSPSPSKTQFYNSDWAKFPSSTSSNLSNFPPSSYYCPNPFRAHFLCSDYLSTAWLCTPLQYTSSDSKIGCFSKCIWRRSRIPCLESKKLARFSKMLKFGLRRVRGFHCLPCSRGCLWSRRIGGFAGDILRRLWWANFERLKGVNRGGKTISEIVLRFFFTCSYNNFEKIFL